MNYYEILYIVNPNFERKKIDDTMKEIESRLNKTKSRIMNHVIWGKKKLAYPIQGHKYGTYIMAHYNGGENNALDEFNSWLKLSDLVIRHMVIRLDNEPDIIDKTDNDLNLEPEKEQSVIETEEKSNDSEEEIIEKKEGVE
tara:strand:+ start:132 stop:554 length:423 start_codon:yes stop_codon:yes gene_type:complete